MKKLLLSALLMSFYGIAQQNTTHESFVESSLNTSFHKTPPLRSLLGSNTDIDEDFFSNAVAKDNKRSVDGVTDLGIPETGNIDPVLQTAEPIYKEEALVKKVNTNGLGGSFPPDPSGAAGANYYVQGVNTAFRVFDKTTGNPISGSLHQLNFLWPGTNSDGDPIIMYDRYAERWFISQFQQGTNQILIAISETADPLGAYFSYQFTPGGGFPDYPKFGIWPDGYYMSANSSTRNCVVFEREKMILGDPNAQMVAMNFPNMGYWFRSVAPAYAEGQTEPAPGEPFYYFHIQDNSWSGVSSDNIKVLKCVVDWNTTSNSSITIHQTLPVAPFNSIFGTGSQSDWNNISQKGTAQKLDAVSGIFSYKVQYRRFNGYNTAVMCTTVDVDGNDRAGIRWYELRENNDGVWYIYQEGTYAPDNTNNRWLGNVAMDIFGHMALAYSFSGPNEFVGIRYTGRFKDDPLNQMTVQEKIAVEGSGSQTAGNRFGDYSQMTMDPSDDYTFWFTGEYLGAGGNRKTRIISFSSWHLAQVGQEEKQIKLPFFNAFQPNTSTIQLKWNDLKDENITIEFYDMNGKLIISESVNGNLNGKVYDVPNYAKGIYLIKLKGENTNLTKKVYIS